MGRGQDIIYTASGLLLYAVVTVHLQGWLAVLQGIGLTALIIGAVRLTSWED